MIKRSQDEWYSFFHEHKQSGQTAVAFCRERGLCPRYFSKRRKQLLNSDPAPHSSQPAFVPVTVAKPVDSVRIELELGEGHMLTLPASISPTWLADLIHHLRA